MRSVLLIEHDGPNAKLERLVLEADGWVVLHAGSLDEARLLLASTRPDLIITDLAPPLAVERFLALRHVSGSIPVVAVTAVDDPDTERHTLAAGCARYIRKPIDIATFSTELARLVKEPP